MHNGGLYQRRTQPEGPRRNGRARGGRRTLSRRGATAPTTGPSRSSAPESYAEDGASEHLPPKKRSLSLLARRCLDRQASKARRRTRRGDLQGGRRAAASTGRGVLIGSELIYSPTRDVAKDSDDVSLLQHWWRRTSIIICQESGGIVAEAELPHLGFIARLYHGIESTSYQSEPTFYALTLLVSNRQMSMVPGRGRWFPTRSRGLFVSN